MEEIAFQDWPGPPLDSNTGNNPWMPAYGFQTPSALLEREDFIGNPDAEYFLHGSNTQYAYLETIQEETSDDLRSDSDVDSRNSPAGWLATDSEGGSVICMDNMDEAESESDREIACPPKRRKQETYSDDGHNEETTSLSRSSSLLQFETLEKECLKDSGSSNHSPSVCSQFSFDSLEVAKARREFAAQDFSAEYDGDIFKNFDDELNKSKQSISRDSLLYNASIRYSSSSDSSDSDVTVENSRSCDNLKTWRSFDSLLLNNSTAKKFSSENLSEDSGYGDQLLSALNSFNNKSENVFLAVNLSSSAGNLELNKISEMPHSEAKPKEKRNSYVGFGAYDCEVIQNFNGNFGTSYQDLSIFDKYDPLGEPLSKSSPLTDMFLRRKHAKQRRLDADLKKAGTTTTTSENSDAKFRKVHAASVPNLLVLLPPVDIQDSVVNIVCSVPKDLNFVGDFHSVSVSSVAEKDWNLADLHLNFQSDSSVRNDLLISSNSNPELNMTSNYKREGSYTEAMSNRVDLSDDENSLVFRKKLPKSPIVDFDRRVLKAISEQSLQSLLSSTDSLHRSQQQLDKPVSTTSKRYQNKSVAASTPDLDRIEPVSRRERNPYFDDDRRKSTQEISSSSNYDTTDLEKRTVQNKEQLSHFDGNKNILLDGSNDECDPEIQRKGSIIKSSTSTSGMSDIEEKTLRHSVRSFTSSNGSKGVHFSPVVAEVNWRDDVSTSTVTPDRESLYSLNSSSPEPPKLIKPKPQYPPQNTRRSVSQPELSDSESKIYKREYLDSLNNLRKYDVSKSQPDVSKLKRRGSQLVKKDRDGCTVKAYVDIDGVQYQHTHLDLKTLSQSSLNNSKVQNSAPDGGCAQNTGNFKNSLTSKFPFYQHYHLQAPPRDQDDEDSRRASGGHKQSNVAMVDANDADAAAARTSERRKSKSGLGGFLQRLASFRLGAKKSAEQKDRRKRTQGNGTQTTASNQATNIPHNPAISSTAQKPDYIYIPLKGPSSSSSLNNNNNNNNGTNAGPVSAGKPPLPKQPPPRIVHASVKKASTHHGVPSDERRRRRTIDSTSGVVETASTKDVGRHHGNAFMDGPMGLIETDLDTEVTVITNGANAKARSLLDLGAEPRLQVPQSTNGQQNGANRPHKSMEFLLDKQNLKVVEPPENELQKSERVMSEHELRVQRSLQKLTVPEWYKNSQVPAQGFLLKKHSSRETRWTGTGSKTTSLNSLGSGVQSPVALSPTPTSQPFVRWSTSKLNSTASSPCQSTRSSFNQGKQPNGSISPSSARSSFNYRQPYMGWRSQERLNRPRTPAERLASTLLSKQQQESPEIQTSIKEVTSAIVHYVSGLKPGNHDDQDNVSQRSTSPRGSQKFCWLESSFVGTKPLDSPETPVTCSESPVPPHSLRLDLQNHNSSNDVGMLSTGDVRVRPSPSSTTLEDVLDSLLGLPSSGRAASPCLQETVSASTSPQRRASDVVDVDAYRRRSEGSEPASVKGGDSVLAAPVLLRCRYSRCGKTASPASKEAKSFKNCHNCSYTYCSRACRRSHWERHRKTCLFSRMGTLCRQVIQAVRDQKDTLKELSKVARRGYISHGSGAVKCFYPNPEAAEKFLAEGLPSLGELTFVRWQDLLPTEMGPMLYKELVEMCQNYNADTKFVLYISLCVVSETPASGAVKWERQLVSRCAKLRLSKDLNFVGPEPVTETPETLILTCPPIRLPTSETRLRARLIAFNNVQAQLRDRGVSLKRQYPELHRRLDAYCADLAVKFEAQTIYPRDLTTNKSFMCIVMLESEPETLRHVERAGVRVRTVDCLLSCETTTPL